MISIETVFSLSSEAMALSRVIEYAGPKTVSAAMTVPCGSATGMAIALTPIFSALQTARTEEDFDVWLRDETLTY